MKDEYFWLRSALRNPAFKTFLYENRTAASRTSEFSAKPGSVPRPLYSTVAGRANLRKAESF